MALLDMKIGLDADAKELLEVLKHTSALEEAAWVEGMRAAASWCERHAGDATLDRTGVERETLLRATKRLSELADAGRPPRAH